MLSLKSRSLTLCPEGTTNFGVFATASGFLARLPDDAAGHGSGIAGGSVSAWIADVVEMTKLDQFIELLGGGQAFRKAFPTTPDASKSMSLKSQSMGIGVVGKR